MAAAEPTEPTAACSVMSHRQSRKRRRTQFRRLRMQNRLYARGCLAVMLIALSFYTYSSYGAASTSEAAGATTAATASSANRQLLETEDNYPTDAFTPRQREHGAFLLHVCGVLYLFLALAIVCDEFFVPALEVITDKLDLTEDVAGATFMAAGGSAPELSTSFVGTFISKSNVGFGTIVGSAVFNVLFVIAACAFVAKDLKLTWWPLARDTTFYSVFLCLLAGFFEDRSITWWEALIMFLMYIVYVLFMSQNSKAQEWVRKTFYTRRQTVVDPETGKQKEIEVEMQVEEVPDLQPFEYQKHRRMTIAQLRAHPRLSFHTGALALMLSSSEEQDSRFKRAAKLIVARNRDLRARGVLPPLPSERSARALAQKRTRGKAHTMGDATDMKLHELRIAGDGSVRRLDGADEDLNIDRLSDGAGRRSFSDVVDVALQRSREGSLVDEELGDGQKPSSSVGSDKGNSDAPPLPPDPAAAAVAQKDRDSNKEEKEKGDKGDGEDEDDDAKPSVFAMACQWPDTWKGRLKVLVLAPIVIPLTYTLPDMSVPSNKKYYPVTFLGSIMWVGLYSYLMVWWAQLIGDALGIPPEVMGLTFLAAGTSVPDLLTSVIVAKQGWGDMAVSSSLGSNIFDVGVGLPLPWLVYTLVNGEAIEVGTEGLFISIIVLFLMLLFVILTILYNKWVMTRQMGITMMVMYVLFLTQNLLVEYEVFG